MITQFYQVCFLSSCPDHKFYFLSFIHVIDCFNRLSNVESFLQSLSEFYLVILHYHFNAVLANLLFLFLNF